MHTRERITPVVCESCGGDKELKESCVWCERTGMMMPDRLALYRASREQRITGQFQAWTSIVGDLVSLLEGRRTAFTDKLAGDGRRLLDNYDRALKPGAPMTQAERSAAVTELREYHERVLAYLALKR